MPSSPDALGLWLSEQCRKLGVEIRTYTQAISVKQLRPNGTKNLICRRTSGEEIQIPHENLVFAAGPWCQVALNTLFPSNAVNLQLTTDAGDWILLRNQHKVIPKSLCAIFLDDIVNQKLEFAARENGLVWACGRTNSRASLPEVGQLDSADTTVVRELLTHALSFISAGDTCSTKGALPGELPLVKIGRAFRSTTTQGRPILAEIPPSKLDYGYSYAASWKTQRGKWRAFICTGHSHHGIILSMGSGKLMSQLVLQEKPDIDISPFHIPY